MTALPPTIPCILLTGTPGTGKTTFASRLAELYGYVHLNVSELVKQHQLHDDEWDEEFECYVFSEDKVCDDLEERLREIQATATEKNIQGIVVDFHSSGFFPERWFDLIIVLRSSTEILYDRLEKRGYNEKKLSENIECEIMQVCFDEVNESYKSERIVELANNTIDELESNLERVKQWTEGWRQSAQQNR